MPSSRPEGPSGTFGFLQQLNADQGSGALLLSIHQPCLDVLGCDLDSAAGHRAYSRVVSVRSNEYSKSEKREPVRAP